MLQIRLNKGSFADGVSVAKSLPVETVTVACPDHLVIADLPVAKGLGSATSASRVKIVGRRSRRQLGERVHFCVRCDFPIAVYGRLSPCEHAYCLDCARSDSICYLCDERIQKIQTIKMMEGIFVCAAPHCLKSFLKKVEFESHIHETHTDLLHPSSRKEDLNRSESFSGKLQNQASESSSVRTPTPRPAPPPCHMNPPQPPSDLLQDRARRGPQFREQTPLRPPLMQPRGGSGPSYFGQNNTNLQQLPDLAQESGIRQRPDFPGPQGHIPNFDSLSDKQQQQQHGGILSDPPSHYPPSVYYQHPNHPGMGPPPPFFSMSSPLQSDGGAPPPFYGGGGRSDSSAIEIGSTSSEPGLASSFPPGGGGSSDAPPGFDGHPPRPWSAAGPSGSGVPFESAMQAGGGQHMNNMIMEGIYQGDNTGRSSLPPLTPLAVPMMNFNKAATAEQSHQGSSPKGGGVLSSMPPPPPGPPPPHILQQQKHGNFFSGGGEGMN